MSSLTPKEVIRTALPVHKSTSTALPFRSSPAVSYGNLLEGGDLLKLDKKLQIVIASTTKAIGELVQGAKEKGKSIEWSLIVPVMSQNLLHEPYDKVIERSDDLIKKGSSYFRIGENEDEAVVREVKSWFQYLVNDEDILDDTNIDIDLCARIVAATGARIESFPTIFYKENKVEGEVLDIAVLRYPDIHEPLFKIYCINLTAWATCRRILTTETHSNGITGEFVCRKYKPREVVMKALLPHIDQEEAAKQAQEMFCSKYKPRERVVKALPPHIQEEAAKQAQDI
ncbi:hypothetical protein KP509_15G034900 [Ceratopteris richardii]|uniref:Uncharacterized protein n=1 Tax=Ceratopteris richardii TaxID=49495 RepID=A0A8T2T4G7_CERRI|nr:hypothetical protein KP509_15G034900 [Ceratopteris richardii]